MFVYWWLLPNMMLKHRASESSIDGLVCCVWLVDLNQIVAIFTRERLAIFTSTRMVIVPLAEWNVLNQIIMLCSSNPFLHILFILLNWIILDNAILFFVTLNIQYLISPMLFNASMGFFSTPSGRGVGHWTFKRFGDTSCKGATGWVLVSPHCCWSHIKDLCVDCFFGEVIYI